MQKIRALLQAESAPGLILIFTAVIAMTMSNSSLAPQYFSIINTTQPINVIFVVNDLLMAVFFLDVGFEIKHQFLIGHLSKMRQVFLPVIAAVGGVVAPALIFLSLNWQDELARLGWAIPAATDIAFAVGVLILLGKRLPLQLKVLLLAIAVIDDLIAILIIAIFYTQHISLLYLGFAGLTVLILIAMNYIKVKNIVYYLSVGVILWFFMLKSGVHATISGVIIALVIPLSLRQNIHKQLYVLVSFVILPLFAFVNAGLSLHDITWSDLTHPVPLGIALGLVFGKQIGIFGFSWAAIKAKIAVLPDGINWKHIYGMAIICGIGFTMSVFIGNLAYNANGAQYIQINKLGVLIGSTVSAVWGYLFLSYVLYKHK